LSASLLGTVENTLQFVTYEYLRKKMLERRRRLREDEEAISITSATSTTSNATTPLRQESVQEWVETFLVAAVSKLFASMSTYPHEVLRTRLRQTPLEENKPKYTGLAQAVKLIYKEEGIVAFYGGMTAHLMRVVPNAAIMLFCYEAVVAVSEKWKVGMDS
jgi:solute carrier family 25, member 33/36